MEKKFVTYFEVTYANTIAGYTCRDQEAYRKRLNSLAEQYPELELVYREWSDGIIEDGLIEKENY
jgi:hypothetical protein